MNIKNIKIYGVCLGILLSSSLVSCSKDGSLEAFDNYKDAKFYSSNGFSLNEFLEENNLVPLSTMMYQDIEPYYEAKISLVSSSNDGVSFDIKWEKIEDFSDYMGICREVKSFYKVYKIDNNNGNPKLSYKITDDLFSLEENYLYVNPDDYIVNQYGEEVLVNRGKVIERK